MPSPHIRCKRQHRVLDELPSGSGSVPSPPGVGKLSMNGRAWRRVVLWSLTALLLLSACDDLKVGWPDLDGTSGSGSGDAFAQAGGIEYLVAFTCGSQGASLLDPVVTGQYGTLVNIYNPSGGTITVSLRIPLGSLETGAVSSFINENIAALRVLEVDCESIRSIGAGRFSPGTFVSGFLVVQSSTPVEVIATYTAGGVGTVDSIHVERIQAR